MRFLRLNTESARIPVALCITMAGLIWPASTMALTIDEPLITGPPGYVHHDSTGGFDGGYDWVYGRGCGEPEINGAVWEASDLPAGIYEVEAWLPNEAGKADARYQIVHSGITSEVLMSQYELISGEWVALGAYEFKGSTAVVRSSDAAGEPGDRIDWSDMRWTRVSSLPANVETAGAVTTIREPEVSGPEEFVSRFAAVGYGGDSLLVGTALGVASPTYDVASWGASLSAGEYTVEVYVPETHHEALVEYAVDSSEGDKTIPVDQPNYRDVWVNIGRFPFSGGTITVSSSDATGVAGQDIAWSALRLTKDAGMSGQLPSIAPVDVSSVTDAELQSAGIQPLALKIPYQNGLLEVRRSRPRDAGGGRAPYDEYEIRKLFPSSSAFALRFHCDPCLFITRPKRGRPPRRVPHTRRSHASGELHDLLHHKLYKGTVLAVEVSQEGYQPLRDVYTFGRNGVHGPTHCERATLNDCR